MCNPTKYPRGKYGLMSKREKLAVRKYFNQRLLDADGRFAEDVEYLLTAQYTVESKQVADDASIALRQTQGRQHRGAALTVSAIKNQQVIQQMVPRDDECQRFTSLLPESDVRCAWDDQTAQFANLVTHSVGS